jgi:hypothetical protein
VPTVGNATNVCDVPDLMGLNQGEESEEGVIAMADGKYFLYHTLL